MNRLLLAALLCVAALTAHADILPCSPNGNTQPLVAAVSAPTPVQVTSTSLTQQQYVVVNVGAVPAYVSSATTSAGANAACIVPDGTALTLPPVIAGAGFVVSAPPNSYFCGVTTSSSAALYITPCLGN